MMEPDHRPEWFSRTVARPHLNKSMHPAPPLRARQPVRLRDQREIAGDQPVCQVCVGDTGLLGLHLGDQLTDLVGEIGAGTGEQQFRSR